MCPVTLMGQWADELADKTEGRLKVLLHHGAKRSKVPADLAGYDIVLVTYQTLRQEFGKGWKEAAGDDKNLFPPCGSIQWHRIVLDEAHTVKNPNAQLTKACKALSGDKRSVALPAMSTFAYMPRLVAYWCTMLDIWEHACLLGQKLCVSIAPGTDYILWRVPMPSCTGRDKRSVTLAQRST